MFFYSDLITLIFILFLFRNYSNLSSLVFIRGLNLYAYPSKFNLLCQYTPIVLTGIALMSSAWLSSIFWSGDLSRLGIISLSEFSALVWLTFTEEFFYRFFPFRFIHRTLTCCFLSGILLGLRVFFTVQKSGVFLAYCFLGTVYSLAGRRLSMVDLCVCRLIFNVAVYAR